LTLQWLQIQDATTGVNYSLALPMQNHPHPPLPTVGERDVVSEPIALSVFV